MDWVGCMDEKELRQKIYEIIMEVSHFSQVQKVSRTGFQKKYFQIQIEEAVDELFDLVLENQLVMQQTEETMAQEPNLKEFTIDELASYKGSEGKPPYVAVNGKVYDVSSIVFWEGGNHFGLIAGKNLSDDFMTCHGGSVEILQKLPVVGIMAESIKTI
jgi:Predicted heme/steroid binding protein